MELVVGSAAVFAGRPGRYIRQEFPPSDPDIIEDWIQCVLSFSVSSKENMALNLFDTADNFWQSSGPQGKVICCIVCALLFVGYLYSLQVSLKVFILNIIAFIMDLR